MPSLGVGARLWASESTFLRVGVDFWPGGGLLDTGGSDLRWNLNYLALPVSVGRFLGDSELGGPYVHAGGVFALAVSEKWEFADLSGDSRGPGYDLGPVVGIGYDRISGSRVGIATELFWGLIDQSDDPEARADVIFLNRSVRVLLEVAIGTQAGE